MLLTFLLFLLPCIVQARVHNVVIFKYVFKISIIKIYINYINLSCPSPFIIEFILYTLGHALRKLLFSLYLFLSIIWFKLLISSQYNNFWNIHLELLRVFFSPTSVNLLWLPIVGRESHHWNNFLLLIIACRNLG